MQSIQILLAILIIAQSTSFILSAKLAKSANVKVKANPVQINTHEPIILALPNVIPKNQIAEMLQTIDTSHRLEGLLHTNTYQEDVFSKDAWKKEDFLLRSIVQPLVDDHLIHFEEDKDGESINSDYKSERALQMFVYAVTNHQDRICEENIILGANIIQRRQAMERWKSEEGQALMLLSLDEKDSSSNESNHSDNEMDEISLGKRYEIPSDVLSQIEQLVPRVLKGSWVVKDATLVQYSEGDTQVPHIDPCDATLLITLKSCEKGGDTCFPMLEQPRRLQNKAGSGILFFSSLAIVGDESRNALSLHHGGKVVLGEKVVVQLMLDWVGYDASGEDAADDDYILKSWLDVVKCL